MSLGHFLIISLACLLVVSCATPELDDISIHTDPNGVKMWGSSPSFENLVWEGSTKNGFAHGIGKIRLSYSGSRKNYDIYSTEFEKGWENPKNRKLWGRREGDFLLSFIGSSRTDLELRNVPQNQTILRYPAPVYPSNRRVSAEDELGFYQIASVKYIDARAMSENVDNDVVLQISNELVREQLASPLLQEAVAQRSKTVRETAVAENKKRLKNKQLEQERADKARIRKEELVERRRNREAAKLRKYQERHRRLDEQDRRMANTTERLNRQSSRDTYHRSSNPPRLLTLTGSYRGLGGRSYKSRKELEEGNRLYLQRQRASERLAAERKAATATRAREEERRKKKTRVRPTPSSSKYPSAPR